MPLGETAQGLLASSAAGFVSRVICHPIDTLKARLQAPQLGAPRHGLYRGLTAALVGGVPATCMYLTSYELCKKTLSATPVLEDSPFAVYFVSGMAAEACSCTIFVPTDVIKERLQVQGAASGYNYRGSWDALRQILAQEGARGLYRGYGASLLSFGPFSALYFAFYEHLKAARWLGGGGGGGEDGAFLDNLYSAAVAGAAASYLTNPLDLAKLRLQVSRAPAHAQAQTHTQTQSQPHTQQAQAQAQAQAQPRTTGGMLAHVVRSEGPRGLFRGALARVLFHTPNTAITMCAFEEARRWLRRWE